MLHEDVATDVLLQSGLLAAEIAQGFADVAAALALDQRAGIILVAHQAQSWAWHAEADGDFWAQRDEVEIAAEHVQAQSRGACGRR